MEMIDKVNHLDAYWGDSLLSIANHVFDHFLMTVIHIPEHQNVSAKLVQLLLLNEEKIRFISNLTRRVSVLTHTHASGPSLDHPKHSTRRGLFLIYYHLCWFIKTDPELLKELLRVDLS